MINELPPPRHDLRHLDPEVRKERVKLAANGLNAFGLALLIGAIVAPIVDPTRTFDGLRVGLSLGIGLACILAAGTILRYMRTKEAS